MKEREFIQNVAKVYNITNSQAKKHCITTIVKESYGYIKNDLSFIIRVATDCDMTKEDAIHFFENSILPKMDMCYEAKYRIAKMNNELK